jgi:hypothetical protein
LIQVGVRSISAGIAALAFGVALESVGTYVVGAFGAGSRAVPARISSAFETIDSASTVVERFPASQAQANAAPAKPSIRVASAGMELASYSSVPVRAAPGSSFAERFLSDQASDSFDDRFASAGFSFASVTAPERTDSIAANSILLAQPNGAPRAPVRSAAARSAPKLASVTSSSIANVAKKRVHVADTSSALGYATEGDNHTDSHTFENSHTAIYDISAHTVYLPSGRRLEAHSGLGSHMDDPRYVNVRHEGATPPNVYDLKLRESLFHGVRALRLTPAGEGKMYGRDGILAHSYMLGPNGQSNGCVSFSNYQAFLDAYLKGEVERLVVVEHLDNVPAKAASDWLPEGLRNLFGRSST